MKESTRFGTVTTTTYSAAAPLYSFTDLGTLGGALSIAHGINNAGQVVGASQNADGEWRATLWDGTTPTALGVLGWDSSTAHDINDAGKIVGSSVVESHGCYRAAAWNGTTPTDLGWGDAQGINTNGLVAGFSSLARNSQRYATAWIGTIPTYLDNLGRGATAWTEHYAIDINDTGQVVGRACAAYPSMTATVWIGGIPTDIGSSFERSGTSAVNNAGQVVGWGIFDGRDRAILWNGINPTILEPLGGFDKKQCANDINDDGLIVGWGKAATLEFHALIWNGITPTDLNKLVHSNAAGWTLNLANAINRAGQIVGSATNSSGQYHAYLLTP